MDQKRYSFSQLFIWGAARSRFWAFIAKGMGGLSTIIILSLLSVYEYGLYQLVLSAVAIAGAFVSGLFDDVVINELSRALADRRFGYAKRLFQEFFSSKVLVALLVFAALFLGAGLVAQYYGQNISSYLRIAGIMVVLEALQVMQRYFFRIKVSLAASGVAAFQELARLVLLIGFWFWSGFGIIQVLWSNVLALGAALGYAGFFFIGEYRSIFQGVRMEKGWQLSKLMHQYGWWVFLRYAFSKAFKGSDVWLVRVLLNTEAVGLYALAMNLITLAQNIFPTAMLGTLLPWRIEDHEKLGDIYRRALKYGTWSGVLLALGMAGAVPLAVALFFPKYLAAMYLFLMLLFTLPIFAVHKIQKIFLITLREQKILTMRIISENLVRLAILASFLPVLGLAAAALSYFATSVGRALLYTVYIGRNYPYLKLKLRHFFEFDRQDRQFFGRAWQELLHPWQWLRPVRVDVEKLR